MPDPKILEGKVWCPFCKEYAQLMKVQDAIKLVGIHKRTMYRYIANNVVYAVKVAGKTYRVCASCLLKRDSW